MAVTGFGFEVIPGWGPTPATSQHKDTSAVDTDSTGRVYLLTRKPEQVLSYDADGRFLTAWTDPLFENVHGLSVAPDDSVWISDNGNHTVRQFTAAGQELLTLGTMDRGSDTGFTNHPEAPAPKIGLNERVLRSAGPFNGCTNVAFGPGGDIYVADGYYNARIHRFSSDGTLERSWGDPGSGPGQFHLPHGIAVDHQGRVLVCDRENDRIQLFDLEGRFIEEWLDVQRPTHVDLDREGNVYVSELWRPVLQGQASFRLGMPEKDLPGRVSVLSDRGAVLARWGADSSDREAAGNFAAPHGICVDAKGDVYVAEVIWNFAVPKGVRSSAHQIQKFQRR